MLPSLCSLLGKEKASCFGPGVFYTGSPRIRSFLHGNVGISHLPKEPVMPSPCSSTPVSLGSPRLYRCPTRRSYTYKTNALAGTKSRGSITRPLYSLSTLRANITVDYARLASGWRLTSAGQDWLSCKVPLSGLDIYDLPSSTLQFR